MTLTVYDKNFQITRKGQTIENETDGTNILRIELSMKRNAYYRALKLKPGKKLSYDVILHKLCKHGSKLIRKQMKNLFPCDGKHLPYQKGMKSLLKQFDAIQVNPITFRKDSKIKKVESFRKMLL